MFVEGAHQVKMEQYKDLLREAEREQILRKAAGKLKGERRFYSWQRPRWRPLVSPSKLNWQRGVRVAVTAGILGMVLLVKTPATVNK